MIKSSGESWPYRCYRSSERLIPIGSSSWPWLSSFWWCPSSSHVVMVDTNLIRIAALKISGAAGTSGLDVYIWWRQSTWHLGMSATTWRRSFEAIKCVHMYNLLPHLGLDSSWLVTWWLWIRGQGWTKGQWLSQMHHCKSNYDYLM